MTIDETFSQLLDRYTSLLGERTVQMLREDWAHGEPTISFENLLTNLQEMDAKIDDTTRQQLRSVAEALGMLEDERGKGLFYR